MRENVIPVRIYLFRFRQHQSASVDYFFVGIAHSPSTWDHPCGGRGLTYSGTGGVFARNAISWRIEPFFMRFRPHPSDSVARILVEFASAWDRTCGGWVLFIDDRADLRAKPRPLGLINHFAILSASVRIRRLLPRRIRLRAESYMWRMGIYRGTSGVSARKRHF